MNTISMHDLKELLPTLGSREVLLDVRTPEEFSEGHIQGAKNISHEDVANHASELKQFDRVYVFCRSGKRSQLATQALIKAGLNNLVCISNGGMMHWIEAGYPVEKN